MSDIYLIIGARSGGEDAWGERFPLDLSCTHEPRRPTTLDSTLVVKINTNDSDECFIRLRRLWMTLKVFSTVWNSEKSVEILTSPLISIWPWTSSYAQLHSGSMLVWYHFFYINCHMHKHVQSTPGILEMLRDFNGQPITGTLVRRRWLRRECDLDNIIGDDILLVLRILLILFNFVVLHLYLSCILSTLHSSCFCFIFVSTAVNLMYEQW